MKHFQLTSLILTAVLLLGAVPKPAISYNLLVDKSENVLFLKDGQTILKKYTVSTGKDNSTPVGVFKVTDRLKNPTWYTKGKVIPYGSAGHEIGTRWIGINRKGYGIHGTVEPEKLGQSVSAGCVRMRNEEVEELFNYVSRDTRVTIVE